MLYQKMNMITLLVSSIKRCFTNITIIYYEDGLLIGGGSAGCVLANRLSSDTTKSVLLVEAGWNDKRNIFAHAPGMPHVNMGSSLSNWGFNTEPQQHLANRKLWYPRGRLLGGSSQLNSMVYIRGNPVDYDRWVGLTGDEKFGYEAVLALYKKSQSAHGYGDDEYNGRTGYLHTSKLDLDKLMYGDLANAFINAGIQAGSQLTEDFNGPNQEGFGGYAHTAYNGQRSSSSHCFLRPISDRENLTVLTSTLTHRCLIDHKNTCYGIEVSNSSRIRKSKKTQKIFANEVVLCGGAINTPQLLLLSGIGPKRELEALGIHCNLHLPGVGKNLQDHLQVGITYNCKQPITLLRYQLTSWFEMRKWIRDPMSAPLVAASPVPVGGFSRIYPNDDIPNMQHHFVLAEVRDHGRKPFFKHRYGSHLCTLQPLSKGEITLKTSNPHDHPIINPKSLSNEQDLFDFVEAFKHTRKVFTQSALDDFNAGEYSPGNNIETDDEIATWLRQNLYTCYHPVSTARIGTDDMSVCDTNFKIKSIRGLRAADASVMPDLISGNTNAPTMMLAEMCAIEMQK